MNEERDDEVKRLWQLGYSVDGIALQMGITRNAVAGVCWRAGLRRAAKPVPRKKKTKTMNANDGEVKNGVEIMDLKDHHCRWIVGKDGLGLATYCGERKVTGSSYCLEHTNRSRGRPMHVNVQKVFTTAANRDCNHSTAEEGKDDGKSGRLQTR
jgi:hypothetical protein